MWLATLATATAGRDADEDQQRRHQEAAADAEHAGNEPDREPHREHEEDIDGKVGDRKIDFHGLGPTVHGTTCCARGRRASAIAIDSTG